MTEMSTLPNKESRGTFIICEAAEINVKVGPNFLCALNFPVAVLAAPLRLSVQGNSLSAFSILLNDYISKCL